LFSSRGIPDALRRKSHFDGRRLGRGRKWRWTREQKLTDLGGVSWLLTAPMNWGRRLATIKALPAAELWNELQDPA